VILATGTFLRGTIHIGLRSFPGGRNGERASVDLAEHLMGAGLDIGRLKTGTSPRVSGRSIDLDGLTPEVGDPDIETFSYRSREGTASRAACYITRTNRRTHEIIRSGLDRSPLFTGRIEGVGPRYCPSIEDKVTRFPDRESHVLFLEPEGTHTLEYYISGLATSLPEDIQIEMVRSIAGLERGEITRPGYAVEYDFAKPTGLYPTLETKRIRRLFLAGQINGTSGYEEAAAQGIVAGINAALKVTGGGEFVLGRAEAYTGVMIDDLVTCGTEEPYRMFTSRAEHRLILRQDNADERLMEYGHSFGLIPSEALAGVRERVRARNEVMAVLERERVKRGGESMTLKHLLRRPEVDWKEIVALAPSLGRYGTEVLCRVEIEVKYEGYIKREHAHARALSRKEGKHIPDRLDYAAVPGLSLEATEKLSLVRPRVLIHIEKESRKPNDG
jgi:tRNA uridine 5-carboxymethylaminomethyl modification enzyme